MKRSGIVAGNLIMIIGFTGCQDTSITPEEKRFDKCMAMGGSYASEDTSAGNKWTCTVDGEQATIHDEN